MKLEIRCRLQRFNLPVFRFSVECRRKPMNKKMALSTATCVMILWAILQMCSWRSLDLLETSLLIVLGKMPDVIETKCTSFTPFVRMTIWELVGFAAFLPTVNSLGFKRRKFQFQLLQCIEHMNIEVELASFFNGNTCQRTCWTFLTETSVIYRKQTTVSR